MNSVEQREVQSNESKAANLRSISFSGHALRRTESGWVA